MKKDRHGRDELSWFVEQRQMWMRLYFDECKKLNMAERVCELLLKRCDSAKMIRLLDEYCRLKDESIRRRRRLKCKCRNTESMNACVASGQSK